MVHRKGFFWSVLLIGAILLTGCSRGASGAAGASTAAEKEAIVGAVVGYMQARKAIDLKGAYKHLSGPARKLYTEEEFVQYYSRFPAMEWKRVGPVTRVSPDWARVVVYDITVTFADGRREPLPDFPYYVQRADGKWGVALINPMLDKLETLSGDRYKQQELFEAMMKVNPYSTNLHSHMYYYAVELGDAERAAESLGTLYMISGPSDLANLQALWAHFYLNTGQSEQALKSAERAMKLSEAYPERYGAPWAAGVLTTKAHAHMALRQTAQARSALNDALLLEPDNLQARLLLQQVGR